MAAAAEGGAQAHGEQDVTEYHFKILVVGEQACGKTCILHRYIKEVYLDQLKMTVGVDFTLKQLKWDANTVIRLQFWDIAGQERFGHMTPVCHFWQRRKHTHTHTQNARAQNTRKTHRCTTARLWGRLLCTT